ncbi:putative intraflagellar transport protein 88 [Trypanosoma cruzi]|uniref:Putative intraflagellar transport protein 88 n=1 Tax=Trypanosoma cruzi TaxID=5693 RepID=A0A2V2VPH0_TRYCR|nr:putative intraflagellar transport protein 88 [Trypanosoma cruzi]
MEFASNDGAEEDLYAAFEPESENAFAASPRNYVSETHEVGGGGAVNPLMQAPPSRWGATSIGSAWGVPGSRVGTMGGGVGAARPMTSNRGVGFNAAFTQFNNGAIFDPAGQGRTAMAMGPAPPLKKRGENSPEEQCAEVEKLIHKLIEESAMLALQKDYGSALEKAKEASKKERQLCKQREQLGLADQINADLTYAVHFNLAVQYQNHQLYTDALNTYSLILRNLQFSQAARLRINMGNIHVAQGRYLLAIKMYRLTLDETPTASRELRHRLLRSIGNAFVKLGQYRDAVASYEAIMEGNGDVNAGFNLLLCYYALGEPEKMKRTFQKLLNCKPVGIEDEDDIDEKKDVLVDDALCKKIKEDRSHFLNCIMTAARLIAPVIEKDWRAGYDYLIERLRHYEMRDSTSHVASELEMCKCLYYLKHKSYKESIDGLKAFEKKDKLLRARAATNLAYLYFLEGDHENGEKYSDMSLESNRYNARALVNKGNFLFMKGSYEKAKVYYNDALAVEADNIEAIYNLGLTAKRLGLYEEALKMFKRVQSLVDSHEVMYQIADINDLVGNPNALEWFNRLIGRVPTDPNILARMGSLYAREGDDSQAFHYYLEAYRYYQVNMDVISWLGAYFVKNEIYDKAIQFFERASQIQPLEVKWQLMVASCHRRRGDYIQAKRLYEAVHRKYPENMECLRYLVHLCKDAGLIEEANEWFKKIKKLEQRQQEETDEGGYRDEDEEPKGGTHAAAGRRAVSALTNRVGDMMREDELDEPRISLSEEKPTHEDDDEIDLPGI